MDGQAPYIVSEYVDGRPLSETVRDRGPMFGPELHRLAVGTLNALIAIHQANVVHRDFKPSNVLLGADRPRVIDFGIARALDSTMSMTSGVIGTPAYMAPEQLNGQQVTPAVDVFAWAATMVFAATGAPPFGQDSIPVMMHRILNADPVIGNIQSPLRELVWYSLYKSPAQRPTTHQVLAGLGAPTVTSSQIPSPWGANPWGDTHWGDAPSPANLRLPPDAPPPSQPLGDVGTSGTQPGPARRPPGSARRRWLRAVAAAAGVALVAAATVVVVELGRPDPPPKHSVAPAVDAALTKVVNPSTAKGGTLKLVQSADFDSLDPGNMYYTSSWNFSRLYARSLLTYPAKPGTAGLRPVPDLAVVGFDDVHCRLAVQYAVDRPAAQTAAGGVQAAEPATNMAPPVIVGRQRFDPYPADTAKAKQELASCGRPAGFSTRIAIRKDRPKDKALAGTVQQALSRVGITVRIEEYSALDFYRDYAGKPDFVHKNDLGMILSVWGPDYPTAMGFFPLLVDGRQIHPTSNSNLSELNDSGVNEVLDRLAETKDQATREGLTAELDRKVMGTAAVVPLLYDKIVLYRAPRLTNASVSQMYVGYDLTTLGIG